MYFGIFFSEGEARCLRRNDLVEALANALPLETIRFGCQVLSVNVERCNSTMLQLHDGSVIKAKVFQLFLYTFPTPKCARGFFIVLNRV